MEFLRVRGQEVVTESGRRVFLRGVCLGGWLNMENFISGFIGAESSLRRAIREELGEERYRAFFSGFTEAFVDEDDFRFFSQIGVTAVRVPFHYRLFEEDMHPGDYSGEGFRFLDRAIDWGRKYGIYVILDLHATAGWQNMGWHCDNPYGISLLWNYKEFQDRGRNLWRYIADRYKDEPVVAGYNILNEPNAPSIERLNDLYRDWITAIREVDPRHIVFVDGNRYSREFKGLDVSYDRNVVFSSHHYAIATHRARNYPGWIGETFVDRSFMEQAFLNGNRWVIERGVPSWIGEFGGLFDGPVNQGTPADRARLMALKDQLAVFNGYNQHWTLWTYKDVGVQGLAVVRPDCEYMRRIKPILKLKKRLGTDAWTARNRSRLMTRMREVVNWMLTELEDYSLDGDSICRSLGERAGYGLLANELAPLYANCFSDMNATEIRDMLKDAFAFAQCVLRRDLIEVLSGALRNSKS